MAKKPYNLFGYIRMKKSLQDKIKAIINDWKELLLTDSFEKDQLTELEKRQELLTKELEKEWENNK